MLMARSDEIEFVSEESAALNCLSSMDENRKKKISDKAISTVISLVSSDDNQTKRYACCTIANLAEMTELQHSILREHGLPISFQFIN